MPATGRRQRLSSAALLCALLLAACSAEQVQDAGTDLADGVGAAVGEGLSRVSSGTVSDAVGEAVTAELGDLGITLASTPACTPSLARQGAGLTGTIRCTATTLEQGAVRATFRGALGLDGCRGGLRVAVDGERVVDTDGIPVCLVLGL